MRCARADCDTRSGIGRISQRRLDTGSPPSDQRREGAVRLARWEFERGEETVAIATPGPLTVDASHASIGFGLSGVGIIYGAEPVLHPHLESGALTIMLGDWASMGSGFHAYYSSRRQAPTALRLLIDLVQEMRPLAG